MLRFNNKKGKQVMELHDNGDMIVEDLKLKLQLALKENVLNLKDDEKVEDNKEKKDDK